MIGNMICSSCAVTLHPVTFAARHDARSKVNCIKTRQESYVLKWNKLDPSKWITRLQTMPCTAFAHCDSWDGDHHLPLLLLFLWPGGLPEQPWSCTDTVCLPRGGKAGYAKHGGCSQQPLHPGALVPWRRQRRPGPVALAAAASDTARHGKQRTAELSFRASWLYYQPCFGLGCCACCLILEASYVFSPLSSVGS